MLLGAGASIDAGLPGSLALTDRVVDHVLDSATIDHDAKLALKAVMAPLAAARCTDIETLFSAVEMLARIGEVEIAPLISGWKQGIDPSDATVFNRLKHALLDAVVVELQVDESRVDYLEPLVRLPCACIATLNYDLSVELAAK